MTRTLDVVDLGRCAYRAAWERQRAAARAKFDGSDRDTLFLVEHPSVITLGRRAAAEHVVLDRDRLAAEGVECIDVDRGGDVTYHGPGQLVAYPVIDLKAHRRDVGWMLRQLEQAVIDCLAHWGIAGFRDAPYTGVWTDAGKVAAIGIAVNHWVTYHGTAINVAPDMRHFQWITPCGIPDRSVTSMAQWLGEDTPAVHAVGARFAHCLADVFNVSVRQAAVPVGTSG